MDKLLAVFDRDSLYATRLMEHFKRVPWENFEILVFTRRESLVDFLTYQSVDILLYGEDAIFEELPKENIKYIFWLSNDKKQAKDKEEMIYKYQAASKITSDIISCYTRLEDKYHNKSYDKVSFITVYPPVPGVEKICYAWSLAKELSNNSKVLFINLELLPAPSMLGQEDKAHSMSEFLYYLKERRSNYMDRFKEHLNYSEKLSYLSGPVHGFDLLSLSKEDVGRLMDDIRKYSDYETVIVYLGIYTEGSMEILSRSNEICIATCSSPYEEFVLREWERQMELIGLSIDKQKINRLQLPTAEQLIGENPLPEHIYRAIKPLTEELVARL